MHPLWILHYLRLSLPSLIVNTFDLQGFLKMHDAPKQKKWLLSHRLHIYSENKNGKRS